jgi:hypothetical protein
MVEDSTYRRPSEAHHVSFFLELAEFETHFDNGRENLIGSLLIKEIAFFFHQDQDAVIVQFCHPVGMAIAARDLISSIARNVLLPKI